MKRLVRLHTTFSNLSFRIGRSRIGIRSPPLQSNPSYNTIHKDDPTRDTNKISQRENNGNKVVVVVDSTKEAKDALQWALTHVVQKEDSIILLHIASPTKKDSNCDKKVNPRVYGLLCSMKSVCKTKKPGVEVEFVRLQGKDKGKLIVKEATQRKASVLILGHRRRSLMWRLMKRWRGNQSSNAVADYCIQNSSCMTIAVRRKSRRLGGYLITTKRHKNFWLLA